MSPPFNLQPEGEVAVTSKPDDNQTETRAAPSDTLADEQNMEPNSNGKRPATASQADSHKKSESGDDTKGAGSTGEAAVASEAAKDNAKENDEGPDEPPVAKRRTLCGVCHTEASKYKCPRCTLPYCSVACSRIHRENHPPTEAAPAPAPTKPKAEDEAEKAKNAHPFSVLDNSPELKRLFAKYTNLPTRLRQIYEATLPPNQRTKELAPEPDGRSGFGGRGNFRGGRGGRGRGGRGRGRGGQNFSSHGDHKNSNNNQNNSLSSGPKDNRPWTKETGLREGQKALRRARIDPSEDGDGVREYCELVTALLSPPEERRQSNGHFSGNARNRMMMDYDPIDSVRQEVLLGDAQLIQQLRALEGQQ